MDEPLSNLDAKLRTQTRGEIRRLQQEVRTTTVYVTHDQVEAMTMGDRIAVMNEGVLEQVGTPEELYERPANRFVAGFIGSPAMSFFEASSSDGRLRAPEIDLSVNGASLPSSVVVGVRPEHARPWRDGLGRSVARPGRVRRGFGTRDVHRGGRGLVAARGLRGGPRDA